MLSFEHSKVTCAKLAQVQSDLGVELVWMAAAVTHEPRLLNTLLLKTTPEVCFHFWPPAAAADPVVPPPPDMHPECDPLASLASEPLAVEVPARSSDEEVEVFVASAEVTHVEASVAAAAARKKRANRKAQARNTNVPYAMDRDKVKLKGDGKVVGRFSLLMAWSPPSCAGKCFKHQDCSATADLEASTDMCQWIANGSKYDCADDHWKARPARDSNWRRRTR